MADRPDRAGERGGVQSPSLRPVPRLPDHLGAAGNLAYQFRGKLTRDVAVRTARVDIPAAVRRAQLFRSDGSALVSR
jgi:hypothetical protein